MLVPLLRLFIRLQKREFLAQTTTQKTSVIILCVVFFFLGLFFANGFGYLAASTTNSFLLFSFQSLIVMLFIFLMMFTIPHVFDKLYGSKDLHLLFSLPLPTRTIFLAKLGEHLLTVPLFLFLGSTLFAVIAGIRGGAAWSYFLWVAPIILFSILGAIAFVYLMTLAFAQLIPGHRTKELMTFTSALSGIIVFLLVQGFNLSSADDGFNPESIQFSYPGWLPTSWAGEILTAGFNGTTTIATWGYFGIFLSFVISLLFFSLFLVERGFRHGWIKSHDAKKKKRKSDGRKQHVRRPLHALILKERAYFFRDIREWLQLMPIIVLLFVMVFPLFNQGLYPLLQEVPLLSYGVMQLVFFLSFSFAAGNFTASSVGREGPNIHLLSVLPIRGIDIARAKFLFHWFFLLAILAIFEFIGFVLFSWPFWLPILGFFVIGIAIAGLSSLSLYVGTQSPRFNERQPQARVQTAASFLLMFASLFYILIFFIPVGLAVLPLGELERMFFEDGNESNFFIQLVLFFIRMHATNTYAILTVSTLCVALLSIGLSWYFIKKSAQAFDIGIEIDLQSK